jgi:zinc D-Ala-D-Ala carboxypeptidase
MTQLTKNFSLAELTRSDTATRLKLDNTPTADIIASLTVLAEQILQPVRDHYAKPVKVNSGYRAPAVNVAVGGSATSDHCKGMAADIEISGISNYDLAEWIKNNLKYTQLILEFYTPGIPNSGWVHVSYDPANLKCQCLTAVKENGKTVYKQGLIA